MKAKALPHRRGQPLARPAIFLLAGLVLLALLAVAAAGASRRTVPRPEAVEVVSDRPLRAVHGPPPAVPAVQAETGEGRPRAELSADYYDFGVVPADAVMQRDFLLVNRGSAPLVIRAAYTTCGCTTADITASVIPPGKAARATVIFDAAFHPVSGQTVRRGLVLETNDPDRPEVEIWVQARVR